MPRVCVLGSGIIGLASATLLKDAGYNVVVVARDTPGSPGGLSWASPCAGATILSTPDAQDPQLQKDTFIYFWALAHRNPTSDIQTLKATEYFDNMEDDSKIWAKTMVPHYRRLKAEELPEGVTVGYTFTGISVNPLVFLPWLQARLEEQGVQFVVFEAESLDQVRRLTGAKVLVNATGLGAKKLAHDNRVHANRGQTIFVRNRPDWKEVHLRQGSEYTYTIPRMFSGGVIIGGSEEHGSEDTTVDQNLRVDILRRVNKLTNNAFADLNLDIDVEDIVGFRPAREGGFRLDTEGRNTIHAYGFDGMGYLYSFGTAKRVVSLVEQLTSEQRKL